LSLSLSISLSLSLSLFHSPHLSHLMLMLQLPAVRERSRPVLARGTQA
jgi:hypothetical protein